MHIKSQKHLIIPKVTSKVINQDRMFFVDFSVNCQPIFMKFGNIHIRLQQNPNIPENFVKLYIVFQKLDHLTCDKFKLRRPSINPLTNSIILLHVCQMV